MENPTSTDPAPEPPKPPPAPARHPMVEANIGESPPARLNPLPPPRSLGAARDAPRTNVRVSSAFAFTRRRSSSAPRGARSPGRAVPTL